jgi:hypothetical protein
VFAIRNLGRYSGEDGHPAWLGWGADHFSIAPDGSFWIARRGLVPAASMASSVPEISWT